MMSDDPIEEQRESRKEARQAEASPAPDERDATIERLERTVTDQRQRLAQLLKTVEESRFRIGVLEKGYSKQLADARLRSEAAERELADQRAKTTELEGARENTQRSLTEAEAEIKRLTTERDHLRKQLASTNSPHNVTNTQGEADLEIEEGQTINTLMDDTKWRKRRPADDEEPPSEADEPEYEAPSSEEMLAPELFLSRKRADSDVS